MELHELESVLDARIDPLKTAITKLEGAQEKVMELLTSQARQEATLEHIRADLNKNSGDIDKLFACTREMERQTGDKVWDAAKIIGWALLGVMLGGLVMSKM